MRSLHVMVACAGRSVEQPTQLFPSQSSPTPASHRGRRKRSKTRTSPNDRLDAEICTNLEKLQ